MTERVLVRMYGSQFNVRVSIEAVQLRSFMKVATVGDLCTYVNSDTTILRQLGVSVTDLRLELYTHRMQLVEGEIPLSDIADESTVHPYVVKQVVDWNAWKYTQLGFTSVMIILFCGFINRVIYNDSTLAAGFLTSFGAVGAAWILVTNGIWVMENSSAGWHQVLAARRMAAAARVDYVAIGPDLELASDPVATILTLASDLVAPILTEPGLQSSPQDPLLQSYISAPGTPPEAELRRKSV